MEFKLKENTRNLTNDELLQDIREVAIKLNKDTITTSEYSKYGKADIRTIYRRFGSFKKALELCGLKTKGHNFRVAENDFIEDVKMVAKILNKRSITTGEYKIYGKYDWTHKVKKYKSWNNILALAGLEKTNNKRNTTDEMLLEEILKIWILLERQPTTADIRNGVSIYSLNTYARHFGSWSNALKKFVEWINDDNVKHSSNVEQEEIIPSESLKHKTPREINLRLRYLVLKRDNFKCCICGSSPAKDPSVELHIDHIVPWSKGGETIIDNLQTLCSKCNLGKSNIDS